jgi:hypothetical protein
MRCAPHGDSTGSPQSSARDATSAIARAREAGIDVDRLLAKGAVLTEAHAHRLAVP